MSKLLERNFNIKELSKSHIMEFILVIMIVFLSISARGFATTGNIFNVLRNISMQGIIAFGMTMVIITAEIDLSVGSMVAFSGCLTAKLTDIFSNYFSVNLAIPIAIIIALLLGFLIGAFTAFCKNRFNVPTLITSLSLMVALRGGANLITGGFPVTPFPNWYNFLGGGYLFGVVPFQVIIFLIVFIVLHFIMSYTIFGRAVYATGGNIESARLSGINVSFVKVMVFGITGFMASISGVLVSAQIMSGTPIVARAWEMDVIAAVIIGGTNLFGGSGKIRGTLLGIIFFGIVINGMTLLNVSEYWQHVVRGALTLAAVMLNTMNKRER